MKDQIRAEAGTALAMSAFGGKADVLGHPSVSSQKKDLIVNNDGSVDVWFGPEAPAGKEGNWVQTVPGHTWNVVLRLYGALERWCEQSWRPGEIELPK